MIEKIEKITFNHFSYLPNIIGCNVNKNDLLTIINCGLGSSLFNIVCNTHLEKWAKVYQDAAAFDRPIQEEKPRSLWNFLMPGGPAISYLASSRYGENFIKEKIEEIIKEFKGQPFAWWVGYSCDPHWLPNLLEEMGFKKNTTEHAMALDLQDYKGINENENANTVNFNVNPVSTAEQLENFISILEPYDSSARPFYSRLKMEMLEKQEQLYVGYNNGTPVSIGTLYHDEDTAGIFSLLTDEKYRGQGFGTQMMLHLIQTAKSNGNRYVTLSASSNDGYRIYERLGFKSYGEFDCLEWKGTK